MLKKAKGLIGKIPYGERFLEDKRFKNVVGLYCSGIINLTFIVTKYWDGFSNHLIWPISLATYYLLLLIIKILLLKGLKSSPSLERERRVARKTGYLMLVLNLFLTGMIAQMIVSNVATRYGLIVVITNATYAFYRIVTAIFNVVRYRKQNSPILMSIKIVNLVAAMVTIIMLQTTMIASLSDSVEFMQRMNGITGLVISIVIVAISLMLIRNKKRTPLATPVDP